MLENPVETAFLSFGGYFEQQGTWVGVELQTSLPTDDFCRLFFQDFKVVEKSPFVVINPAHELLFFQKHLALELFGEKFNLQLQLHFNGAHPVLNLLSQIIDFLQVAFYHFVLTQA